MKEHEPKIPNPNNKLMRRCSAHWIAYVRAVLMFPTHSAQATTINLEEEVAKMERQLAQRLAGS